jgi:hypothetical protein
MQVILRVKPEPAARRKRRRAAADPFASVEKALGLQVQPLHPGSDDPELQRFFAVDVPDRGAAERALALLRRVPAVDAAYVKPEDEPP